MPRYQAISISIFFKSMNEKNITISSTWCVPIIITTRICSLLEWSCSLLDQIFCKVPCKKQVDISASVLLSGISYHSSFVVNDEVLNKKLWPPRYVYKRSVTESTLDQYRTDLRSLSIKTHLKADLMTDPKASCQIFENLIQKSYQRHFPENPR